MARLIIQPAGGRGKEHFRNTVEQTVDLEAYATLLGYQLDAVRLNYPTRQARVWGVTPGSRGTNIGKFDQAQPGDVVLFTRESKAFAGGVLAYKLHSAQLAEQLWQSDEDGLTWEYIYLLDDVCPLDIGYEELRHAASYEAGYDFWGFNVLNQERSDRALSILGPMHLPSLAGRRFGTFNNLPTLASGLPLGQPYTNVTEPGPSARDPFTVDPNEIDRGNRGHVKTQNALAEFVRAMNIEPLKPSIAAPNYDLAWEHDGVRFVAEVKSLTQVNQSKQLRLALGQVLDYADQLAAGGRSVRPVIAVEVEPSDWRWVDLCLRHGVTLVWPGRFEAIL
jgi:hypothetical protein